MIPISYLVSRELEFDFCWYLLLCFVLDTYDFLLLIMNIMNFECIFFYHFLRIYMYIVYIIKII